MFSKKDILKGAGVLLIAAVMVLSTVAVTADTTKNEICLSNEPATTEICQPEIPGATGIVLWDQYDTDGSNGLSHFSESMGYRRALLDDFEITDPEGWIINDFHMLGVWNTLTPPQGTDWNLSFWSDAGGAPGAEIVNTVTVSYTETVTGRTWFSRPEFEVVYTFEDVVLPQGTYWIWGYIIGPADNCFLMAKQDVIWGSECWCDYEDQPPLRPGHEIFADYYDLTFQLTYTEGPPPVPLICCEGDILWEDVHPGEVVNATFEICNCGEPGSFLDWEICGEPDWGEDWTFDPASGTDLPEGECVEVKVSVKAPDIEEEEFEGEIKACNSEDPDDSCTIDVRLITPFDLLDFIMQRFPILGFILNLIF